MTAILTLLIALGLAPADARQDPCKAPGWAISSELATACDFDDARTVAELNVPTSYTGSRTQAKFIASRFTDTPFAAETLGDVLLVSDRAVSVSKAPEYVKLMGPAGGWVDAGGTVHGAYDAWTMKLAETRISSQPAGTLVSLVKRKQARPFE
ncbi:hypothetical protein PQH03_28965 [Ralstonia insidiosa]|jgi:hypothetical protein|uniref:Uncharacterized protein n=1 Tax=Ralstonia insidiosa TaxID=190721 RepID=A0A192A7W4_9RALS|nr:MULTISPECIES: hypothetical protein [Ralstonia]KMW47648.1 hypothetical protein AC240_08905 [Ralstonia sp. MD27]ANJ76428.1 hypothetical protein A9Y76_27930 [Ralstonia insidiosa]MBA9869720.1 hypothetical protein [Ralstonia insidiosa]MBA9885004.1 hypothetical protein [Ralstonia pickettii]MBA9894774.1 hypothetical protein [Ralstonia pickettii]